jgi:DNA-binding protein HU-beta
MTKAELIAGMAAKADVPKAAAAKALEAFTEMVSKELKGKTGKLGLVGFGTFSVVKRKAREGRNPQTGKKIKIAAKKVVKFKAGKALADKVNK